MTETNATRAAGSSAPACSDFDVWWYNEGSGIVPKPGEDMEEHARRVAAIAWENGAYKAKHPTSPNAAGKASHPPARSAELWRVQSDPVCQQIWRHAEGLPLSELPKALEIMRLCALLYVELNTPNNSSSLGATAP